MMAVSLVLLTGCLYERPMIGERVYAVTSLDTLDQQRAWVAEQFDAAIKASEIPEGWFDLYWQDVFWADDRPEDRALLLSGLFPRNCSGAGGELYVTLLNRDADTDPSAADPVAAAAKVRAYWESAGWIVTDLHASPNPDAPHFIGNREDGATLAFRASEIGMSLDVATACSVHSTVVSWWKY